MIPVWYSISHSGTGVIYHGDIKLIPVWYSNKRKNSFSGVYSKIIMVSPGVLEFSFSRFWILARFGLQGVVWKSGTPKCKWWCTFSTKLSRHCGGSDTPKQNIVGQVYPIVVYPLNNFKILGSNPGETLFNVSRVFMINPHASPYFSWLSWFHRCFCFMGVSMVHPAPFFFTQTLRLTKDSDGGDSKRCLRLDHERLQASAAKLWWKGLWIYL